MSGHGAAVAGALCAGAAVGLWLTDGRPAGGRQRLLGVLHAPRAGTDRRSQSVRSVRLRLATKRRLAALALGLAAMLVVGGPAGPILGLGTTVASARWLSRLEPSAVRSRRARVAADVPLAADLLAALLQAGATTERATEIAAATIGGPLGDRLTGVVAHLRLGADPSAAWLALDDEPALAPIGKAFRRVSDSGATLAQTLSRLAADQRAVTGWHAELAARRVGVRTAGPLGLCFLPAFLLIGVIPTIAGIVRALHF